MTITEARKTIATIIELYYLYPSEIEALSLADQALKTIEDMKTKGATFYGNQLKF